MTPATPPPVAPAPPINIPALTIGSPKRNAREEVGWHGFFPYYAGYPHSFADRLIESAALPVGGTILDPWNGSGTTTYSAAEHGFLAEGWDVNPVMVIIARARLLPLSEADMLGPLARDTVSRVRADQRRLLDGDPLLSWFERPVAALIRGVEVRIREQLVGATTFDDDGARVERMSAIAATFYVALFSVCRDLVTRFQASNPTWLRKPKAGETLVSCDRETLLGEFIAAIDLMASSLEARTQAIGPMRPIRTNLGVVDTALAKPAANSIDLILSSPPYCTRIDYSAATRIELAILYPRLRLSMEVLGRTMIGSTRVPKAELSPREAWGDTCLDFLVQLKRHPSKASDGYYYKTHLDYFDKMARSLEALAPALRPGAAAILVVQDSFYKEIHNDLPTIIGEMGVAAGLTLARRVNFASARSMSGINPYTRIYKRKGGALEAVLCFQKPG
jgi:DNA modification methylase